IDVVCPVVGAKGSGKSHFVNLAVTGHPKLHLTSKEGPSSVTLGARAFVRIDDVMLADFVLVEAEEHVFVKWLREEHLKKALSQLARVSATTAATTKAVAGDSGLEDFVDVAGVKCCSL